MRGLITLQHKTSLLNKCLWGQSNPPSNTGAAGGVINHSDGGQTTRAPMMMMTMMEIALLFTDQPWYERAEIIRRHLPPSFSGMQSGSLVQAQFKMSLSDLPKPHLCGEGGNYDPWTGEFPRRRSVCNQPLSGKFEDSLCGLSWGDAGLTWVS